MIGTLKKCEEIIIADSLYQLLAVDASHQEIIREAQTCPDFNCFLKGTFAVLDKQNGSTVNIQSKQDFMGNLRKYLKIENGRRDKTRARARCGSW